MKKLLLSSLALGCGVAAFGQSAIDAFRFAAPDMKGTARFMSMGGAFGALGGDLTTLSQNPAGIGVYRSHELGFTLNLDCQQSTSDAQGFKTTDNQTKFLLNNIGGVATLKLNSSTFPNFNFGFTYNKAASFNRRYRGTIHQLSNSMSNYIAGVSNGEKLTLGVVQAVDGYDPYNPNDGGFVSPWISILGFDSYLVSPIGNPDQPRWTGLWGNGTSGLGNFSVEERGHVDEYNIAFGGNIANVVYWGMDFGIIDLNYSQTAIWGESLNGAYVDDNNGGLTQTKADWRMKNLYSASGNGFNYKLGIIVKPIQELRIGFAFHTPTWYNINESYAARVNYNYNGLPYIRGTFADTNGGVPGSNSYDFRTPWKLMASIAGVIGNNFILSADYEWTAYDKMKFSYADGGYGYYEYDDPWYYAPARSAGPVDDPYYLTNKDVSDYYQTTHTFRLGAEYRVTPQFSVRAGYSFVSSPVKSDVKDNKKNIYTSGTNPSYSFDNTTNYVTCGLGYRVKKFYVDLAYVYKHVSSEYHAFTPDTENPSIPSPQAKLSLNNSQIVLSAGFRF